MHMCGVDRLINPDATAPLSCKVIVDGTKAYDSKWERISVRASNTDASAVFCRIARNGAVGQGEGTSIEDAATVRFRRIARNGAVGQGEGTKKIVDAAAFAFFRRIARNGAVGQDEGTS